ncbi:MAG: 30S ribosomal protein S20 [Deltaproteobacteria bacterium]|nr:30S ribosomal protein S20 [Deltaproteobacteria bacterium]
MANHPSAVKRARQNEKRRARNHARKTAVRTLVKKVRAALEAKDLKAAEAALPEAISALAKNVTKGVAHKRTAARKISRLTSRLNSLKK